MGAKQKYPNRHGPHFLVRIDLKFEMLSSYPASLWISRLSGYRTCTRKPCLNTIKQANCVADAPQWNNPGFPRCSVSRLDLYCIRLHVNSSLFPLELFSKSGQQSVNNINFWAYRQRKVHGMTSHRKQTKRCEIELFLLSK